MTDPTNAVVAAAAVTVTNTNTGIETKTSSDSSGTFVVTPLPVGNYSVLVETPGFSHELEETLTADDVARAVMFAVAQPPHVDVNEILIRPTAQSS